MNYHISLQLRLESLLQFVVYYIFWFIVVIQSLKSKPVSKSFRKMRAKEASDDPRRQSSVASIQAIYALDVRN